MSANNKNITWVKTSDNVWQAEAYRTPVYVATITKVANDYNLLINPGSVTLGPYTTLNLAKNAFRKYLFDK